MNIWSFIIQSNTNYIRSFINNLDYDDLNFYEDGDEESDLTYYFSSPHLNHLTNANEIYSYASQICDLLNGIELIIQEDKNDYEKIILDRLIDLQNEQVILFKKEPITKVFNVNFTINPVLPPKQKNYIINMFELAKNDQFICNLLFLISGGMSFVTLYQVYDEIRTFLNQNNDSIEKLGFSKASINNFTHTANNFQVLGKDARHGTLGHQAPTSPMPLNEAQKLVSDIIRSLLEKYFGIELPIKKSIKINPTNLFES